MYQLKLCEVYGMNNKQRSFKKFLSDRKKRSEERSLLKKIKGAFKNEEFKIHLQFIVDSKTKKFTTAETLSRWENALGEIIFPGAYIGLMEKSGLIVPFDYYMFEKVCQKLSEWKNTDFDDLTVSCNITRITISEKRFVSKIEEIANRYDFDRSKLVIEITEDSIEKNMDVAQNNIIKIKELGFGIALDDIGSGYTSLLSLCEYPIDMVKLDRSLLLHSDKERGKKLFLGVVSLIHSLDLKVVCEGVETEEQNTLATESGCDYIQGWYYTKALPADKAEAFYKESIMNL